MSEVRNLSVTNLESKNLVYIHCGILQTLKNEIHNGSLKFISCLGTARN
jgi:hypothetical protein